MEFHSGTYRQPEQKPTWWHQRRRGLVGFARRHPMLSIVASAFACNGLGSMFNIAYNFILIVNSRMDETQREVFGNVALVYNGFIYPLCFGLTLYILWPLRRTNPKLLAGHSVSEDELQRCRKVLVELPLYQIGVNSLGWLPGAIIFPLVICTLGSDHQAGEIWGRFIISFVISALFSMVSSFFIVEEVLIRVFYPVYFQNARPTDVKERAIAYPYRLAMLWSAVTFVPLVSVGLVAWEVQYLDRWLSVLFLVIVVGGIVFGGGVSFLVGSGLLRWLNDHKQATARIAAGDLKTRVFEKRPDEWGRLTDRFNDMAEELEQAAHVRETFGQISHPVLRDIILEKYPGLGGEVQEVTVMFADIRGFTRRTAGVPPEEVFELINQFMTLAVLVIEKEESRGVVHKFLGDGFLALFGKFMEQTEEPCVARNYAEEGVNSAIALVQRLEELNQRLAQQGQAPLKVGIGIHTGRALVGCVGAHIMLDNGEPTLRREFTAIGETVNLAQRLEQMTKRLDGPILISDQTRQYLNGRITTVDLGEQEIPGYSQTLGVHRVFVDKSKSGIPKLTQARFKSSTG
ncbi:MAG: adenylate/guanylate cyclase domain-containing protein [Gemmataceae bacterium]